MYHNNNFCFLNLPQLILIFIFIGSTFSFNWIPIAAPTSRSGGTHKAQLTSLHRRIRQWVPLPEAATGSGYAKGSCYNISIKDKCNMIRTAQDTTQLVKRTIENATDQSAAIDPRWTRSIISYHPSYQFRPSIIPTLASLRPS